MQNTRKKRAARSVRRPKSDCQMRSALLAPSALIAVFLVRATLLAASLAALLLLLAVLVLAFARLASALILVLIGHFQVPHFVAARFAGSMGTTRRRACLFHAKSLKTRRLSSLLLRCAKLCY